MPHFQTNIPEGAFLISLVAASPPLLLAPPSRVSLLLGDTSLLLSTPVSKHLSVVVALARGLYFNLGGHVVRTESRCWSRASLSARFTTWHSVTLDKSDQSLSLSHLSLGWTSVTFHQPSFQGKAGAYSGGPHSLPFSNTAQDVTHVPSRLSSRTLKVRKTKVKTLAFAHSFSASIFHYSSMGINSFEAGSGEKKSRSSFSGEILDQPWPTLFIAFATT